MGTATCADYGKGKGLVMGYYDGNTVTGLWNYAQHFAMSDNSYGTTFGPSTPGALNLVSGQTHGFSADGTAVPATSGTVIGDPQPAGDACDTPGHAAPPPTRRTGTSATCSTPSTSAGAGSRAASPTATATHTNVGGVVSKDYIPHHEPFQYYASTANPKHTPPASVAEIGHDGPANHQYDLTDFWSAVNAGNMPAVSFLKAAAYQDGHAGYSHPAGRAALRGRHDQQAAEDARLEEHRGRPRLRRQRRLVRPPDGPDREPVERPGRTTP